MSPKTISDFFRSGGGAVLYFFILSGFIMTYVYYERNLETTAERRAYFLARVARIVPLYYIALAFGILGLVYKGVETYSTSQVVASALAKILFVHSFFPTIVIDPPWANATWTLSVEFVFYLAFPFCIGRIVRSSTKSAWLQMGIALALAASLAPLAKTFTFDSFGKTIYYHGVYVYPGFFWAGMLLERLRREYASQLELIGTKLFYAGMIGLLSIRALNLGLGFEHLARTVVACVFILGVFYVKGIPGNFIRSRGLVLLGEASYALYLLHGPVRTAFEIMLAHYSLPSISASRFTFGVYTCSTIVFSILAFRYIETPIRKRILTRFSTK